MSASKEDHAEWLTIRFAGELKVEPSEVDQDTTFDQLGLDSLSLLTILGDLAEHLGCELETSLLFEHPTINRLATFLAKSSAA